MIVFSRTLRPATYPGVRIVNDDPREVVTALKAKPGRDIWLFGGGEFFRSLLNAGLVDTVEVAVVPVLPGSGIPLLPHGASTKLTLADHKTLWTSGITMLSYSVPGGVPAPRIRYIKAAKARLKRARRLSPNRKSGPSRRSSAAESRRPLIRIVFGYRCTPSQCRS